MVRTGEVRPDDNLTEAYARNSSHKDNGIFVRFFGKKETLNPAVYDVILENNA